VGSASFYESRFGSLDSAVHSVGGKAYQYLRVKKNPFSFTHSADFEKIIIIPNTEENMNLVILIPNSTIANENMLQVIRSTLSVSDDYI
jgi:hypothetical protein